MKMKSWVYYSHGHWQEKEARSKYKGAKIATKEMTSSPQPPRTKERNSALKAWPVLEVTLW
jgi:hypothetical protein